MTAKRPDGVLPAQGIVKEHCSPAGHEENVSDTASGKKREDEVRHRRAHRKTLPMFLRYLSMRRA
jgi:hypothetical protein